MGYPISRSNVADPLKFLLVLSSDHITGATGKTPTVTILKNGAAAFASPIGAITEIGNGWYQVAANATDADTIGVLLLHATATACDPRDDTFSVVNYDPNTVQPLSPPTTATFGTTTARLIISGALELIGVKDPWEPLEARMGADGLRRLNNMIDAWTTQRLTIFSTLRSVYALVADQASYTIGEGGDFDQVRPTTIESDGAALLLATSPAAELPIAVWTEQMYRANTIADLASTLPTALYYNPTYPLGTITLWPVPNTDVNSLVLYTPTALTGFASLSTQYAFPPGYAEAIEYNLAKRLASPYGKVLPPDVAQMAVSSLADIKRVNTIVADLGMDAGLVQTSGGYSILSDTTS